MTPGGGSLGKQLLSVTGDGFSSTGTERGHERDDCEELNFSSCHSARVLASRMDGGLNDRTSRPSAGLWLERNVRILREFCRWKMGEKPWARFESSSNSLM